MFFILSKVLSFILAPALWITILLLLAIISKKKKNAYLVFALILFYFLSNRFIINEVAAKWETKPTRIETLGKYDYAIVLGGFSSYDTTYRKVKFSEAGDRLWQALQLYETGKVKKLFISSGSGQLLHQDETEADKIKAFLITLNVPEQNIVMEMTSRNTHENAVNTAEYIRKHSPGAKCLLVTSAWHMPRALGCFQKVKLNVVPYATHYITEPRKYDPDLLLVPQPYVISIWGTFLKEWVGYLSYKVTSYI